MRYEGRLTKNGQRFDKGTIRFRLGAGEVHCLFNLHATSSYYISRICPMWCGASLA